MAAAIACLAGLPSRAALLVYEGFDYSTGPLDGKNGGTGFSGAWRVIPADYCTAFVWDEGVATNPVVFKSGQLDWDGDVSGIVPTSPSSGARFVGNGASGADKEVFGAYRMLSKSAGEMAGPDHELWMSAVYHFPYRNFGSGINIGLGTGYVRDRGKAFQGRDTDYIGATGYDGSKFNFVLNVAIADNGAYAANTAGPHLPGQGNDLLVVLHFIFGSSDTVEGCVFSEHEIPRLATFNERKIGATYAAGIDENTFSVLSFMQGRGRNAIDEIRIGDSFDDVTIRSR